MLRRIALILCVGLIAGASADQDKLDKVQKSLDNIMAKAGISFNGEFKSQYFNSTLGGDQVDSALRATESNEFTSVDFDIQARPNTAVSGRLIFRMHENWQNFFSDIANPIFTRWISIDGTPKDIFRFSIGNFKRKYSPLTLYAPELEMMYEPYIFERQRQIAMDEFFLGDNNRVMQGIDLGFDAEVAPIFNEFHLGVIGSRLRSSEVNYKNGARSVEEFEMDPLMSKYFSGVNLDLTFLKGVQFGGTFLYIFDHLKSYKVDKSNDTVAEELAQRTGILSVRPGIDIAKTAGMSENVQLKVTAELARSSDDSTWFDKEKKEFFDTAKVGTAINVRADFGIKPGEAFGLRLNASLISNSRYFRNELAQTPTFIGQRIMNIENDNEKKYTHYSTYDAMYHSVFKFVFKDKANGYMKGPAMKNSYYNGILTSKEMEEIALDPSLQLVMPFGPATPNRVGLTGDLCVSLLNNGIELKGLFKSLNEQEAYLDSSGFDITKFTEIGAGLKIELSNLIKSMERPFNVSLSMVKSAALNQGELTKLDYASTIVNAGLYWKFLKRAALLGGFQSIDGVMTFGDTLVGAKANHWSAGLEWSVSDGASVVGSVGQIVSFSDEGTELQYRRDWYQGLIDVSLRVKF
ncbi:MAG: hypothetical protein JW915_04815 [Chitinispirillaceae bacterium]|nr:hypothetical protein [Chitinispirillaceae bacterium]